MASWEEKFRELEQLIANYKAAKHDLFPQSSSPSSNVPGCRITEEYDRRTLLFKIHSANYTVSWETLDQIFSRIRHVEYIEVFGPDSPLHSKIRFQNRTFALLALMRFDGQHIYDGCCRMDISLADEVSDNMRALIVDFPHQEAIQHSVDATSFSCTIDNPDVSCLSSYHLSKITVQVEDSIDIENHEARCAKDVHNIKEIKAMKVLSDHVLDLSDIALDELYEFGADSTEFACPKSWSENPNGHSVVLNQPLFELTDSAHEVLDEMPTRNLSFLNALDMEKSIGSVEALIPYSLPYDRGKLLLECGKDARTNFYDRTLVMNIGLYCLSLLSSRVEASFEPEILGIFSSRQLFVFDPGICLECKTNCLSLDVLSATEKADIESSFFVFDPGGRLVVFSLQSCGALLNFSLTTRYSTLLHYKITEAF